MPHFALLGLWVCASGVLYGVLPGERHVDEDSDTSATTQDCGSPTSTADMERRLEGTLHKLVERLGHFQDGATFRQSLSPTFVIAPDKVGCLEHAVQRWSPPPPSAMAQELAKHALLYDDAHVALRHFLACPLKNLVLHVAKAILQNSEGDSHAEDPGLQSRRLAHAILHNLHPYIVSTAPSADAYPLSEETFFHFLARAQNYEFLMEQEEEVRLVTLYEAAVTQITQDEQAAGGGSRRGPLT